MRLCETSQIIKIAVMTEQEITVPIALTLWRCGDDGDAVGRLRGHVSGQLGATFGVQVGIKAHVEKTE